MDNKITRCEAGSMANALMEANFRMFGIGNFDISEEELVNILLIAINREDKEACLDRYYKILHNKIFAEKSKDRGR